MDGYRGMETCRGFFKRIRIFPDYQEGLGLLEQLQSTISRRLIRCVVITGIYRIILSLRPDSLV